MSVMRKFLQKLKMHTRNILYATTAFVPLAKEDYGESGKLTELFKSDQTLVTYLNTLFKMAITVGAILAVLRLLYAGYMYMGNDIWTTKEKAKEIFKDVFLGLFLLLSIFIILRQINPNLLNLKPQITPIAPGVMPGPPTVSGDQAKLNAILADEQNVRSLILNTASEVGINNGGLGRGWCTSLAQKSGCTNVGLLPPYVVNKLSNLQQACTKSTGSTCIVTINGGTEFWMHSTHGPRIPVVDLEPTAGLNNYLLGPGVAPTSGATATKDGGQYKYETTGDNGTATGNHWHVRF